MQPIRRMVPLTFQQTFLYALIQRGFPSGLDTFALEVHGPIDADALKAAVSLLVRRHEALRTRIVSSNATAAQFFEDPLCCACAIIDFTRLSASAEAGQVDDLLANVVHRRCGFEGEALCEVRLVQLPADRHLLIWSIHHIITDAHSLSLMFQELWRLYVQQLKRSQLFALGTAPDYSRYVEWQRQTDQRWIAEHGAYWSARLASVTGLQWPAEVGMVTPNAQRQLATRPVFFEHRIASKLNALATALGTTPAIALSAIYAATVSSWCEQRDFVLPFNITGRHLPEHRLALGYFAQILYLRLHITGYEAPVDLLELVSEEFCEALSHQDFGRIAARQPEFVEGAMFTWLDEAPRADVALPPEETLKLLDISVQPRLVVPPSIGYPLNGIGLHSWRTRDGAVAGYLLYRDDRYSVDTVDNFSQQLQSMASHFALSSSY